MQMLRLRLQYQGAGAAGAQQFDNLNAFGGATGNDVANEEALFLQPFRHR